MSVLTTFVLYLAAFFVMITLALVHVLPVNYLGGIVVGLFILGLIYSWLNAWRQTSKMIKEESPQIAQAFREEAEKKQSEEENEPKKTENPPVITA